MARFTARLSIGKNPGTAPSPPATPQSRFKLAFSGEYTSEADIDANGYVNVLDARMIMLAAAGRIEL